MACCCYVVVAPGIWYTCTLEESVEFFVGMTFQESVY